MSASGDKVSGPGQDAPMGPGSTSTGAERFFVFGVFGSAYVELGQVSCLIQTNSSLQNGRRRHHVFNKSSEHKDSPSGARGCSLS